MIEKITKITCDICKKETKQGEVLCIALNYVNPETGNIIKEYDSELAKKDICISCVEKLLKNINITRKSNIIKRPFETEEERRKRPKALDWVLIMNMYRDGSKIEEIAKANNASEITIKQGINKRLREERWQ